eukprot:CAMPEP_0204334332 /NCGR_PEP_ID=MMETSP0469-20131031/17942_1 /ASSEMBLY_ACC=CAM_ASM_000384 /TAXON_ID=2969 /ORGANISM="Oxyrrhis marina" /LENGTH=268 /DNA_ID=CAMNT_0051317829 /DNA_START=42 /DNA_END=845 /DNA_ORIENTATION=+
MCSGEDETVCIYDVEKGDLAKRLHCKKYGVELCRFVHNREKTCVVSSRNEWDYKLRYWDLHENKFVRYFAGHDQQVSSLAMHPSKDLFFSAGLDYKIFVWDLRREKAVAKIASKGFPVVAVDHQGLVFAVAAGQQRLHLFDSSNFFAGEFCSFDLKPMVADPAAVVQTLEFSRCGRVLLVGMTAGYLLVLDALKGEKQAVIKVAGMVADGEIARPCLSPDGTYVLCGTPSGSVCMWRSQGGAFVGELIGHSAGRPPLVAFSPTRAMAA